MTLFISQLPEHNSYIITFNFYSWFLTTIFYTTIKSLILKIAETAKIEMH